MTPRLVAFIRLLRRHGLRVSVAESLDALHSVGLVGLQDRALLHLTLRTVLVKSPRDFPTFDMLFERFFTVSRRRQRRRARQQPASQGAGQRPIPRPGGQPHTLPPASPPPAPQQTHPHPHPVHQPQPGEATPADAVALAALEELEAGWEQQLNPSVARGESPAEAHGAALETVRLDRDFPPQHLADMYREVERLAARLLARRALRYRRARYGRVDVRQTVVQGLRSGNEVPFTLRHRRRKLTKLRLVILCDVSGSVWQVSTFLLKLVHTLQKEFASVRSFLFVNSMVEVTDLFLRMRFPDDLVALRQYPHLNIFGFSDFGRAFYQFYRDFLGILNRETVIVILGDARNNAFDAQFWSLEEMRQRSRRVLWLNPEPQRLWDTGDSIISIYAPYCDQVLECWTLGHLEQAAELLLQT